MTKLEEIKGFLISINASNDMITEIDSLIDAEKSVVRKKKENKVYWTIVAIVLFLIFLLRGCPNQ